MAKTIGIKWAIHGDKDDSKPECYRPHAQIYGFWFDLPDWVPDSFEIIRHHDPLCPACNQGIPTYENTLDSQMKLDISFPTDPEVFRLHG
jgi:hypothetical protein